MTGNIWLASHLIWGQLRCQCLMFRAWVAIHDMRAVDDARPFNYHIWTCLCFCPTKFLSRNIICTRLLLFSAHKDRYNRDIPLQWRYNERDGFSNHQPHDYLLKRLFRRRSNKTPKLRVTGLCEGNSPVTGEFPAQRASYAENMSIWWRHHAIVVWLSWLIIFNWTSFVPKLGFVNCLYP